MQHAIALGVDAIDHAGLAQNASVVRLSAAGGIKCRAIECDRDLSVIARAHADDGRVKLKQA